MQNLEETYPFLIGPKGEIGYRGFKEGGGGNYNYYYGYGVGNYLNISLDELKKKEKYNKQVDNGDIVKFIDSKIQTKFY
jgi:hypothetical protein